MKILYVTTIGKTMRFFQSFIRELVENGHYVDLAANEMNSPVPACYQLWGCGFHHVDFSRSPLSQDNLRAYGQLKAIIENGCYDIVHCHTPNASVITRLVCRKLRKQLGVKVFYTAHGFHFYKGAPLQNWLLYYPVEKLCAYFTDKLITINQEDYNLAKRKLHAKQVHYVPGVGVDLSKFENIHVDRDAKRREIGVPEGAFLLLSVGELNENKNHQIIIKALAKLNRPDVHYAIAGRGDKYDALVQLAAELGVSRQAHLLGYRTDIAELNCAADAFCFPSYREGLGLAAIEAMICGLPLITSNVHGINDYSENGVTGFQCAPADADGFTKAIASLAESPSLRSRMGSCNKLRALKYDVNKINDLLKAIYGI